MTEKLTHGQRPAPLKTSTHDPKVAAVYKSFIDKFRISCGDFWIFGNCFFIKVSIYADSYNHNFCVFHGDKGNEEWRNALLVNVAARDAKYAEYKALSMCFTDKTFEEFEAAA